MVDKLLEVRNLHKSFGGVVATDIESFAVSAHETHAIIGPNGAGKTTLIAQLSGELPPDSGQILFAGQDITRAPPYTRSRRGLARSFQITSLFLDLSVLDNVCLAVQSRESHSFHFFANVRADRALRRKGGEALALVGLDPRADVIAHTLSHGERRQLELAMALATDPQILLLDEPMAGMGSEESAAILALLKRLKREKTLLLVEHDMDAVFAVADQISVLVSGRIIATGDPDFIRGNQAVARAYLGDGE